MTKKETGGQAFPSMKYFKIGDLEKGVSTEGTTLRDYFAGQAMIAMITAGPYAYQKRSSLDDTSNACYKYADSMLEERNK